MRAGLSFAAVLAGAVALAAICLVWAAPSTAQEAQRPTVRGLFGDRALGQPLQAKAGTRFGTVSQRGSVGAPTQSGASGAMFATPWRRGEPASLQMLWGAPLQFGQVESVATGVPAQMQSAAAPMQYPALPAAMPQAGQSFQYGQYGQLPQNIEPLQQPAATTQQPRLPSGAGGNGTVVSPGMEGAVAPAAEGAIAVPPTSGAAPAVVRPMLIGWAMAGEQASGSASAAAVVPPKPQPAPELSAKITRLARAGGVHSPTGIEVTMVGITAVVRGTVGSEHHRALVANLLRLEPGVWQVENKLTVAASVQPRSP